LGLFFDLMCQLNSNSFSFDCIDISENYQTLGDTRLSLNGYHDIIARCRGDGPRGGVGLVLKDNINFKIRDDISVFITHVFEFYMYKLYRSLKKPNIDQILPELTWTFFRVLFLI